LDSTSFTQFNGYGTANSIHIYVQVATNVYKTCERFQIIDFNPMQRLSFVQVMIVIGWSEDVFERARQYGDK